MGLFKRIAGWFRPQPGQSPFTLLVGTEGEKMLADPAMMAYVNSTAPQPTQAALDSLLDQVYAVRVFNDGCDAETLLGNQVLLEVSEPDDLGLAAHDAENHRWPRGPLYVLRRTDAGNVVGRANTSGACGNPSRALDPMESMEGRRTARGRAIAPGVACSTRCSRTVAGVRRARGASASRHARLGPLVGCDARRARTGVVNRPRRIRKVRSHATPRSAAT
jgi:hypothetical protein